MEDKYVDQSKSDDNTIILTDNNKPRDMPPSEMKKPVVESIEKIHGTDALTVDQHHLHKYEKHHDIKFLETSLYMGDSKTGGKKNVIKNML